MEVRKSGRKEVDKEKSERKSGWERRSVVVRNSVLELCDLRDMSGFNSKAGDHGTKSVSEGKVFWTDKNKVTCYIHRAMNKVSHDGIWRCIMCNEGAYLKITAET